MLTQMQTNGQEQKLRAFSSTLLTDLGRQSGQVLREAMDGSDEAETILNDYLNFRAQSYREVLNGSSGFMKSRELPFSFAR